MLLSGCQGFGWGFNTFGSVGDGTTTDRNSPTALSPAAWVSVSAGSFHSCGIRATGTAWCWGENTDRQVGDGTTVWPTSPVAVSGGANNYVSIDAGDSHTCATRADETLWCWGRDFEGQIGDGHPGSVDTATPAQVAGSGWRSVSTGLLHTCAIRSDRSLWCWGDNFFGQLGDGTDVNRSTPTQVPGTEWETISAGFNHTCAMRTDDTAWCWGNGDDAALGTGDFVWRSTPAQVPGTWTAIEAGGRHTCGLKAEHTAWCWGYNEEGQAGIGFKSGILEPVVTPSQVAGDDWESITPGFGHTSRAPARSHSLVLGREQSWRGRRWHRHRPPVSHRRRRRSHLVGHQRRRRPRHRHSLAGRRIAGTLSTAPRR